MKYLIFSIYDSWYWYSVNINGINYDTDNDDIGICKKLWDIEWGSCGDYSSVNDYLLKEYNDYDLIVICEDGCIEILKDNIKQKLNQWKNLLKIDGGNTKHQVVVDIESILKED